MTLLDASTVLSPEQALDLYGNAIRSIFNYNAFGNTTVFKAVVLTEPTRISEAVASVFGGSETVKKLTSLLGGTPSTEMYIVTARIDSIEPPSPHDYLPDPCSIEFADNPEAAAKIIAMHTVFVSTEATTQHSIKVGDIINVRLENYGDGKYNLQYGEIVGLASTAPKVEEATACQKIAELISPEDKFSFRQLATAAMGFMSSFTGGSRKGLGITNKLLEPIGITLHYTAGGTVQSTISVLKRRGLAYHYIIDRDGTITTLSEPNVVVYHDPATNRAHVGVAYANLGYQEKYAGRYGSPPIEQWYQGPDTAGKTRKWEPYTTAQINASVNLFKELKGKYPGIIGENIKQHSEVKSGKQDGGPALEPYIEKFKRAVA